MAKEWIFGCKLKFFINLGLWIFVKFNGTPFVMYFIEIHNKREIMLILQFTWNWIIFYDQKCFKPIFSGTHFDWVIITKLQFHENMWKHQKISEISMKKVIIIFFTMEE